MYTIGFNPKLTFDLQPGAYKLEEDGATGKTFFKTVLRQFNSFTDDICVLSDMSHFISKDVKVIFVDRCNLPFCRQLMYRALQYKDTAIVLLAHKGYLRDVYLSDTILTVSENEYKVEKL